MQVFDLDFGVFPLVTPIESYIYEMFLDEDDDPRDSDYYTAIEDKIFDYRIHWHKLIINHRGELTYKKVKIQSIHDFMTDVSFPTDTDEIKYQMEKMREDTKIRVNQLQFEIQKNQGLLNQMAIDSLGTCGTIELSNKREDIILDIERAKVEVAELKLRLHKKTD